MLTYPAIFSLCVAAAGWYYMFYSRAAVRLAGIEEQRVNQQRVWLRRTNGGVIFLLALCFYAGSVRFDLERPNVVLFVAWVMGVLLLVGVSLVLGLADLRLTMKLRRSQRS